MGKKDTIRKLFKLLEYTFQGIQFPLEKMRRKETANASLNSETFEDPVEENKREEIRLKDAAIHPGDSGLNYPD